MGYQLSGEDAIKPFVSQKTNGLGLGLNIVNEIMLAQNGKIVFPEEGDVILPDEYADGAVTLLAFKLEDKSCLRHKRKAGHFGQRSCDAVSG